MENNEIPNYQQLAEKLYEVVKGENFDDVEKATNSLIDSLRRSIIN